MDESCQTTVAVANCLPGHIHVCSSGYGLWGRPLPVGVLTSQLSAWHVCVFLTLVLSLSAAPVIQLQDFDYLHGLAVRDQAVPTHVLPGAP